MSHPRVKLSVGASGTAKAVTSVVAVLLLLVGVSAALVAYGLSMGGRTVVTSSLPDGQWHIDDNGKLVPGPAPTKDMTATEIAAGITGGVCALIFVLVALYLLLRVLRAGAWLQGSVLHVRGAVRTRAQDLATARVVGGTQKGQGVQVITATDPESGRRVTLVLRGAGRPSLPGEQLRMLANAITNQRSRSGPDDEAFLVAERLREFASDPFS